MANLLSLALKINADASGLNLTPVERALKRLGDETDKVTSVFGKFADSSEAAARAQEQTAKSINALIAARKAGTVTAAEFAEQFRAIADGAREEAAALERAARITEANLSPIQRYEQAAKELNDQLAAGRITQETYERALAKARGTLDSTSSSADKTDKSIESLTQNVRILSTIEIGRAIIDGFQFIGRNITGAARQLNSFISEVRQSLDEIDKLSLRTGIGREALQEYGVAAELAGVSTDELGATFQRLAANIGRANPPAELQQGLRQLNLNLDELRALAPEQQFALIAERISQLPTAAQRAGAAFGVLGDQGVRLTSLLGQSGNAIEDLRQRSQRLGQIVSDRQIANVTQLNDTFTLVQRTIQGITGQVVGNLAPAVTAVAEELLTFVETFESAADGTGGTGIANAITRVLLDAADYFANKFDRFAQFLSGFSVSIEQTGAVFSTAGNVLTTVVESFRFVFNGIQVGLLRIQEGLGGVLEGIGSWIDSDLEEFGKNLAAASSAEAEKQLAQMNEAATNAANAFNAALDGGSGSTADAGEGAAARFMAGVRAQFEREQSPEFQVVSNLDETAEKLSGFLAIAGDGAGEFLLKSTATLEAFQAQAAAGELTAQQIETMNSFAERLNQQLNIEIARRSAAAEAASKQADADAKRVAELSKTTDATAKLLEDLAAVDRELARVQDTAIFGGGTEGEAARARLEELEGLRDTLDAQLEASALGFAQGFDQAFEATGKSFEQLAEQALEFGEAGFQAAVQLQEGIAAAQEQARDGIFNRAAFELEVARQEALFQKRIADIEKERAAREAASKAAFQVQIEANARVQEFLQVQFGQQAEADKAAVERRLLAAQNIIAIERQLVLEQQALAAAREQNDLGAARAGVERIKALQQALKIENEIEQGRQRQIKQQEVLAEAVKKQAEQAQQAAAQQAEAQRKAFDEQAKAAAAEAERQERRIRALNSIGQQSISGGDIRTSQGASQFLQAAAGAFDPNLAELRAQSKLLRQIVLNSGALRFLERGIGTTFQFMGGGA